MADKLKQIAASWLLAVWILIGLGIVMTALTWWLGDWKAAMLPGLIFLVSIASAIIYRQLLLSGRADPEAWARHHARSKLAEAIRLIIWLVAFVAFLVWGLNGGWSLAWLVLLGAGLVEWLLDRYDAKRRSI